MALIDVPCHQNINKFIAERKNKLVVYLWCPTASVSGGKSILIHSWAYWRITDKSSSNQNIHGHWISAFQAVKKKKMLMCISHLKIWHTHLIWAPPLRELRDLAVKLFWFENHKWKSLGHIDHNSTNINSKFGTTQDHQTIIHIPIIKRVKKVRGRLRKRQYSKSDSKTTGGSITINCCSLYSLQ